MLQGLGRRKSGSLLLCANCQQYSICGLHWCFLDRISKFQRFAIIFHSVNTNSLYLFVLNIYIYSEFSFLFFFDLIDIVFLSVVHCFRFPDQCHELTLRIRRPTPTSTRHARMLQRLAKPLAITVFAARAKPEAGTNRFCQIASNSKARVIFSDFQWTSVDLICTEVMDNVLLWVPYLLHCIRNSKLE